MGKAERIEIEDFVQNIVERMETPEAFEKMISREEECEAQGRESRLRDVLKKEWPVDEKGERIYQITNIYEEKAEELGVTPKVKIEGYAIAGFDAELMGYSPKFSSEKLADKLGLDLKSIDMFEINEAFASQAYAVSRDLGLDPEKVNIYGGGISIGHPIGATGAMLTVKVMYELMRTDKKDAMISMCIGGGQGISMYFTKCEA